MSEVKLPVYIPSQAKSEDKIFLLQPWVPRVFSCALPDASLRWPNTVLQAVSSSGCFKLHKQTWGRERQRTQKTISQNLLFKIL